MTELHVLPSATRQRSYSGDYMAAGKKAEGIVWDWLKTHAAVLEVSDFRELRAVQAADVDYGITLVDGRVVLAEVKSDSYLGVTGNVLFEVLRINHTAPPDRALTLGWAARSPAKWLLYYATQRHAIYQCAFDDLRRAFQRYSNEVRQNGQIRLDQVNTDSIKTTINVLIPWKYCESSFTIHRLQTAPAELPF